MMRILLALFCLVLLMGTSQAQPRKQQQKSEQQARYQEKSALKRRLLSDHDIFMPVSAKQFGKKNKFGSDQKLESKVRAEGNRKTIKASSDEQHISGDLNMMRNSI